jgi:hypothetical protein
VFESTLPALAEAPEAARAELEARLAEFRALPTTPAAAMGWVVHKAMAIR